MCIPSLLIVLFLMLSLFSLPIKPLVLFDCFMRNNVLKNSHCKRRHKQQAMESIVTNGSMFSAQRKRPSHKSHNLSTGASNAPGYNTNNWHIKQIYVSCTRADTAESKTQTAARVAHLRQQLSTH